MKPDITIFFPAYNEEENIRHLLENATQVMKSYANNYEILVIIYEGSTDNTIQIVKESCIKNTDIKLVIQPKEKKGVGYAIKIGFENAKYENIFYTDSDNQFDIKEISRFLPYIYEYDVIAGYRKNRNDPILRIISAKIYNLIMKLLFRVKERDVDCAFRYVNKRIFQKFNLVCSLGLGTTELLAKARIHKFKIKEIPVTHYPRIAGKSVFEGKLINLPTLSVVFDLIKEIRMLKKDLDDNCPKARLDDNFKKSNLKKPPISG